MFFLNRKIELLFFFRKKKKPNIKTIILSYGCGNLFPGIIGQFHSLTSVEAAVM